ncbi:PIN-like domain-containing protein [Streptomyces sp. NPDC006703]|uniref:PIN-like domain-containing protein n=1 Tax=Streptomyces sp. NPDC006703 TaxID=3364759 RepID=UPI0036D17E33
MPTGEEPIGLPGNGLLDGYEGYLSPSDEDYRAVLTSGLVVLDTNVLLNLYRYEEQTRSDLLLVLRRLARSLWVPHQAQDEFWRNREQALITRRNSAKEAITALERPARSAEEALANWARSVGLPFERHAELRKLLTEAFDSLREAINGPEREDSLGRARDTNEDPVLTSLVPLLDGQVGPPLPPEDLANALQEADRRAAAEEPPGYKDRDKPDHRGAGDYLVWEQTLREAERRQADVLIVTSDVKEDWWRKVRGTARGPRLELVAELRSRAGSRLFMLQPQDLLRIAGRLLEVDVQPESEAEIARSAQVALGEGDSTRERIRLYLVTALTQALPDGATVHTGGSPTGTGWDVTVEERGVTVAAVWIYDPIKPFNDMATDSVQSTGRQMTRDLVGDHHRSQSPWLACIVDLANLLRGMSPDTDPWSGRDLHADLPARAAATFSPYARQLTEVGFDHVDMLSNIDGAASEDLEGFSQINHLVDLLKRHVIDATTR